MMHLLHKRGTAIIIVLIILSSLSCLSIFFVRIAMFSRLASENYTLQTLAQLTAYAGMDHSLANTFQQLLHGEIIHAPQDVHKSKPLKGAVGKTIGKQRRGNYGVNSNTYTTRISSEMAKLNINSYVALDKKYQPASNHTLYRVLLSLAQACKFPHAQRIAQLLTTRQINDNKRFTSRENLVAFLQQNFTNSPQLQRFIAHISVSSNTRSCFTALGENTYYEELRAAIDINNVSRELLYALIANIKATVHFYKIKESAKPYPLHRPQKKIVDFSQANIHAMVNYIQKRITAVSPFYSFAQFAQCIDDLPQHFFPRCPHNITKGLWLQIWRDTLKNNFSSDVIDNNCNPNFPMHTHVAKKNLWFVENDTSYCGHTAQGLFFHPGPFQLNVQAYINANERCVSHTTYIAKVTWGKTTVHSTKKDFQTSAAQFKKTLCATSCSSSLLQKYCGFIEPQPQKTPRGLFALSTNPRDIHTRISYFGGKYNHDHTVLAEKSKLALHKLISSSCDGVNHFHHDGLVSRRAYYYEENDNHYYLTHALTPHSLSQDFRGCNTFTSSKVANYNGSIEFWVKLDATPGNNSGLHSMLVSSTTKNHLRFAEEHNKFHEGTQMNLYIDDLGYLHFSRHNYTQTFTLDRERNIVHYGVSPQYRDPLRHFVYRNVEVNISNLQWRRGEWHHIIMRWHDEKQILALELDGNTYNETSEKTNDLATLNEVDPRDALFINGSQHHQVIHNGDLPKIRTLNLFGNATIDNFVSYDDYRKAQYKPRYANSSVYRNEFVNDKKYVQAPVYWLSYGNNITVTIENMRYKNNMLIPKSIEMVKRTRYTVSFSPGKKHNRAMQCSSLGMICQTLLFPYPVVNVQN